MFKSTALLFGLFFFSIYLSQANYSTVWFDTNNGLPQNSIKDIVKDRHGFIWLSTESGVLRYDGASFLPRKIAFASKRFRVFFGNSEKDSIFINDDFVENQVLINNRSATDNKKLQAKYTFKNRDRRKYIILTADNFLSSGGPYTYDSFVRMPNGGIYYLNGKDLEYEDQNNKSHVDLKNISNNNVIFTLKNNLFYIDYASKDIYRINNGKLKTKTRNPILTNPRYKIIWNQVNNQLFITTDHGVYMCNDNNGTLKVEKILQFKDFQKLHCISLFLDKENSKLYVGTATKGLLIAKFQQFNCVNPDDIFYAFLPYINNTIIDPLGNVYNKKGMVNSLPLKKDAESFFMAYDSYSNILIKKKHIIYRFLKSRNYRNYDSIYVKGKGLNDVKIIDNKIFAAFESVSKKGAVYIYDGSLRNVSKKFYFDREVNVIAEIEKDVILVGCDNGLYKIFLKSNKIVKVFFKKRIQIRNIVKTKDGSVWVLTYGDGYFFLKNNTLISIPNDLNNNLATAHTILEDSAGYFWIPSNIGLYKILKTEIYKFITDKNYKLNYYKFSKEDGFFTNEFNGGSIPCGVFLPNGEIAIPSLNGIVFFNPTKMRSIFPKNNVFIERIAIDGEEKKITEDIVLSQNNLKTEVFIDIPYYGHSDNLIMEAKLENSSYANWNLIDKNRKFTIPNLPHGNYMLVVRVLSSGNGNYIYKKIKIIICPRYYETVLFKIAYVFLFCVIILFIIRNRTKYIKKKNKYLEEIISSRTIELSQNISKLEHTKNLLNKESLQQKKMIGTITHDIASPMKFIVIALENLLKNDVTTDSSKKILASVYKSSLQLYKFTQTLREYANLYDEHGSRECSDFSLYKIIEEKKKLFINIAKQNNIIIVNSIDRNIIFNFGKNILSVIIHNLLDNCIKNTNRGHIFFNLYIDVDSIILEVKDTGSGMPKELINYYVQLQENIENEKLILQQYGLGLHLIIQLLQTIQGNLIIEPNHPKGTVFKIVIKKKMLLSHE